MYYFISDGHFRATVEDDARIVLLLDFFEKIKKGGRSLYLLGDIFEFGFEYRRAIPKGLFRVLSGLHGLVRSGVRVTFIRGNHDLWLGDFLEELGIEVRDSPVMVTLDGKRLYLGHGDEADTSPIHRLSQKIFRSRFNIFLFSLLHPNPGIKLAESLALANRKRGKNKEPILAGYARQKIGQGYDIVVLGHTHTPALEPVGSGWYMNVGDWVTNFSYGLLDKGIPEIGKFTQGKVTEQ